MLFVVHQDTLKKDKLVNKMSELNLHLEQANRQYYIDRGRKQVVDPAAGKVTVGLVSDPKFTSGELYWPRQLPGRLNR